MADLVGNDISLGEIAGRAEAVGKLLEEFGIEINLVVAGAVERACCR